MKFTNIFWFMICLSLAIGFVNSLGVFSTNYMTVPEGATFELTDIDNMTSNVSPMSDSDLAITQQFSAISFVKDVAVNLFFVYGSMVSIWHMPQSIAAIIQVIIAVSWVTFLIQLFTRFSWGGIES